MTTKTQDPIEKFCTALKEQGWVLYVPEKVYNAHQAGLLDNPITVADSRYDSLVAKISDQNGILPAPTFNDLDSWRQVLTQLRSSRFMKKYILQFGDGAVCEVSERIDLYLSADLPDDVSRRETLERLQKEFGFEISKRDFSYPYFPPFGPKQEDIRGEIVVRKKYYPPERVSKLRRRIVDKINKSEPADIVCTAKSLGLLK